MDYTQASKAELIRELEELHRRLADLESRESERLRAESELKRKTVETEAIYSSIPDLYFHLSEDSTIMDYRAGNADDLYVPPKAFLGLKMVDVLPADVQKLFGKALHELKEKKITAGIEYSLPISNETRYFSAQLIPYIEDEVIVLVRNITQQKQVELALHASEAKYKELADSITNVFFALNHELKYTYWNRASEELTGILSEEAVGKSIYEIFPDIKGTLAEQVYLSALRTQRPRTFENEFRIRDKDFFFEISVYPSERGLSVFVKDITKRKMAEVAVRASEAKFRAMFEESSVGMVIVDTNGNLKDVNPALQRFLGYEREEFRRLSISDITHPEDLPSDEASFTEVVKGNRKHFETEKRYLDKDGQIVWGRMTLFGVGSNMEGDRFLVGMIEDINRRKLAEEELRQSEARYRALIETAFDDLVLTVNGIIFEAPGHLAEMLGYEHSELIGKPILNFVAPEDLDLVRRYIMQDSDNRYEYHLVAKSGNRVAVEVSSKSIPYHGWRAKITAVQNITERKAMEREKEELIIELQNALSNIKTLRGLLPICAHCKKIRDDKGYWSQLETYIAKHSDAHFTHGLCPQCAKEHYPEYFKDSDIDDQGGSTNIA